jgi:hypothetical protein
MPRPTYPRRQGSQMFVPTWEAYHRPTANLQMTAACTIDRPASQADAVFDDVEGRTMYPPPSVLYAGPCRAQASARLADGHQVGDRDVVIHRYDVAVPASGAVFAVGDRVTFTASARNPELVGRSMWVIDVPVGSLTWQQDLVCTDTPPVTR